LARSSDRQYAPIIAFSSGTRVAGTELVTKEKKYVYGVIQGDGHRRFPFTGIGGQVYTIPHRELAAVVSDTSAIEFSTLPTEEVLRYLVLYQHVTEQVLQEQSILPAKFGTQLWDAAAVKQLLETAYARLTAALTAIEGKLEFDVVALWNDFNAIVREVGESAELRAMKASIRQMPPEAAAAERLKVGAAVKQALDRRREQLAGEIVSTLAAVACELRRHDILADDGMIANVAFLIEKRAAATFDAKLRLLDENYQQKLTFRRVGPLPPHSFYTIEVHALDFAALKSAQQLLRLPAQVAPAEIEAAYRRLARKYHPDQRLGDSKKFEALNQAYKMLINYCQGFPAERYSFCKEESGDFRVTIAEPQLPRKRTR